MWRAQPIEPIEFSWYDYRGYTFSLGLDVDGHVVNSGHSGSSWNPLTGKPDVVGGMAEQTQVAYAKQQTVLAAAGLSLNDVTRVVENVTIEGLAHYAQTEQVRRRVFGAHEPVVVTVVVDRLVRRKALVEIEVHASPGGGDALVTGGNGRWRRDTVREGHDGVVYLPTLLPIDSAGQVVAAGDLAGQYEYCLERAADLLDRAGLSIARLVSTTEYVTPPSRRAGAEVDRVRAALLGPLYPATAGVVMSRLHEPGVLVAVDAVASRRPLQRVVPDQLGPAALTRSPAARAGNTLYLSGLALVNETEPVARPPGDLRAQATLLYRAIFATMAAAGCPPEGLLSTVEFITPGALPAYRDVADVRRELLREPYPVSTGIVCASLLRPEFSIDVHATALVPAGV